MGVSFAARENAALPGQESFIIHADDLSNTNTFSPITFRVYLAMQSVL
jgi:hypothetical protein